MIGNKLITNLRRLLLVLGLSIILLSGCAGQDEQKNLSSSTSEVKSLASSHASAGVPKQDNNVTQLQEKQGDKPINAENSNSMVLKIDEISSLQANELPSIPPLPQATIDPTQVLPSEEISSKPMPAQAQPQVALDLSAPEGPKVGFRAPDFSMSTLNGESFQLSQLLGKPMVINYWATWCVPCKQELPILEKLSLEYGEKGVIFISVNAIDQDNLENVKSLVNELSMTFPVLLDEGRMFADNYQAIFFPTTFMIDASGVIRQVSLGDNTEAELRTSLDLLLAGSL